MMPAVSAAERPRMLFIGDRFPFPIDCGAKIRTTQILRGLREGSFQVKLICPAAGDEALRHRASLDTLAPEVGHWQARKRDALFNVTRLRYLASELPVSVMSDKVRAGSELIRRELAKRPDVLVVDFLHTCGLLPSKLDVPSVLFTHNVEAEIFLRHRDVASDPVRRRIWAGQYRKMVQFERESLKRFDAVVAVSERDKEMFEADYGARNVQVIPTGVDLEYFAFQPVPEAPRVVFLGSMDWMANIDAMEFFSSEVWSRIVAARPDAEMAVVGRNPPRHLVAQTAAFGNSWTYTGFVDDVRPHVAKCSVMVIPLRVGGGTRLKVFEAMAMGCPIVSTAIGVEGLPVVDGRHYLRAESAEEFSAAVLKLLGDRDLCVKLAREARQLVEERASYRAVARVFEKICESVRK